MVADLESSAPAKHSGAVDLAIFVVSALSDALALCATQAIAVEGGFAKLFTRIAAFVVDVGCSAF